jgi:ABC-type amino acid transport substrate-binding protein
MGGNHLELKRGYYQMKTGTYLSHPVPRQNVRISALLVTVSLMMGLLTGCGQSTAGGPSGRETVYDRVVKSKKLKAAWITYPPACVKDTNGQSAGKMSGIFVDTLERVASNLGLTVEWGDEVGWGSQIEGLNTDRYDIVGSPVWANPTRGRETTLSIPVYYSGIGIYVRRDDSRFDKDWKQINSDKTRIVTIDGETGDLIATSQFPLAQRVSLPQTSDISQLFLNVSSSKADVLFAEPYFYFQYLKSNPDNLKNIASQSPIRVLGNCYMFKRGETEMKQMLDVAIEDLLNSGYVDELLNKYEGTANAFYRVARPYRTFENVQVAHASQ